MINETDYTNNPLTKEQDMENNTMDQSKHVYKQYKNSDNLSTRISIHDKYSVNPQGLPNWLFSIYDFKNAKRLLELGCGTGDLWKNRNEIIDNLEQLILTDFSDGMTREIAKNFGNYSNISTEVVNIEKIPYADNSFDIVIANFMLYHVENLKLAMQEIRRVLKPGGLFYSATVGENHLIEINQWLKEFWPQSDIFNSSKIKFNLQNGQQLLNDFFAEVKKYEYYDHLEISSFSDFIDYIFSMKDIMSIDESSKVDLEGHLRTKIDNNGMIKISKQAGTFVAIK